MKKLPTIALVGRPNVGKSRLFNRLAGRRLAIVHDQAGVTRDVNSVVVRNHYVLMDTGGIGLVVDMDHEKLIAAAESQVWLAVEAADVICFVVDARDGLTSLDQVVSERLRSSGKKVILVVNKVDHEGMVRFVSDFRALGFKDVVPISAEHGYNADELEGILAELIGEPPEIDKNKEPDRIKLAFVGRPNVGKSSLCNALLESDRLVVSEVPGTTRDSVMLDLDYEGKDGQKLPFRLIDTAGLRRRRRVSHSVEYFSTVRTRSSIESADIVFLVIEAEGGVTSQDKTLAGEILDAGKCVVLLVNKWDEAIDKFRANHPDGYENMTEFKEDYAKAALKEMFFLPKSPVLFASALRGIAIEKIFTMARQVWETSGRELPTPKVNKLLEKMVEKKEPRYIKNKQFKVYYGVQTGVRPFKFKLFCNRATKLDDGYKRYLQSGFIDTFQLNGCPVQFELKGKEVRYAGKEKKRR